MDLPSNTSLTPAYQNKICCPQPKGRGHMTYLWQHLDLSTTYLLIITSNAAATLFMG